MLLLFLMYFMSYCIILLLINTFIVYSAQNDITLVLCVFAIVICIYSRRLIHIMHMISYLFHL